MIFYRADIRRKFINNVNEWNKKSLAFHFYFHKRFIKKNEKREYINYCRWFCLNDNNKNFDLLQKIPSHQSSSMLIENLFPSFILILFSFPQLWWKKNHITKRNFIFFRFILLFPIQLNFHHKNSKFTKEEKKREENLTIYMQNLLTFFFLPSAF